MKVTKEIRQMSRSLLRASFTDGQLDHGKIGPLVDSLITKLSRIKITNEHKEFENSTFTNGGIGA